jgi:hypothetical protein
MGLVQGARLLWVNEADAALPSRVEVRFWRVSAPATRALTHICMRAVRRRT